MGPNFTESSTLTIRADGPWATFSPQRGGNLPSIQVTAGIYDRLIDVTADGKLIPWVASSWETTPTSLKFAIKKGVTCSDGTPLTPSAIAKHFDGVFGITDVKTKTPGAVAFGPGPYTVSSDDAAGTFTIGLGTPASQAIGGVSSAVEGMIVCPKGWASAAALDETAYGSGPYTVVSADRTTQMTLKLRPDWTWGPAGRTSKGLPGTLVYKVVANDTTAANLLLTGGLDIARILSPNDVKRLLAEPSFGKLARTPLYTNPMWMNMNEGRPTADPVVRQAISTAISAEEYNQAAYGGLGEVTTSAFAKRAPCFEPATAQLVPQTDVAKARQLLLNAGWTADSSGKLSKGGKPLVIQLPGSVIQGAGPEYLAVQLNKVGMTVDFSTSEHVTWSSTLLGTGKWDVIVPGIASDILATHILFYFGAFPTAGRNFSRNTDPVMEAQIKAALQKSNEAACADWKAIQLSWLKNYYMRPLSAQNFYWFSKNPKWTFEANTSVLFAQTIS